MKTSEETRRLNMVMMKVLEEQSVEDAKTAMENLDLDQKELSYLIQDSISGTFVDSSNNDELVKLSNPVLMAGIRNLFKKIVEQSEE